MSFSDLDHAEQLTLLEQITRNALTEHYALDGAELLMDVQQYEDNAVWRVTPPGDSSFVARLSVRDGRTAEQQRSEMRWLQSLATSGAAVPDPVTTTTGNFVVPIEIPGHTEETTLALLHWIPGSAEPPYQQPDTAEKMGTVTAQLHENAATTPLPEFDNRPVWDAETILFKGPALNDPIASEQLGTEGTATMRKVVDRISPALARYDRSRIHGDLHRENLIAMPDGGVGVIDFDDCGWGSAILDIATVLSSIHRIAHTTPGKYEDFATAYLTGYTRIRPLPPHFEQLLEPYLLLRDVQVLNFVSMAIPANAAVAEWGPDRIAGILANMHAYLNGRPYPGVLP